MQKNLTYSESGVNIDAGNALVERIKPAVKTTKRTGVMGNIGGFGGLFDLKACGYSDPLLVACTDGVGTKLKIAHAAGSHLGIGVDLVGMCVNDLVVQGAEPLFFLDYFATGALDVNQAAEVIEGIAEGCRLAGCALIGGETAEMPGMYAAGEYDVAGFAIGAVERTQVLPRVHAMQAGDVVLGLSSDGVHSNGFSLVRKVIDAADADLKKPAPFQEDRTLGEALLTPTRLYVKPLLAALRAHGDAIHALAHITGGGLTENIPRILPEALAVKLELSAWPALPVFEWLQHAGNIDAMEMLRTFNCGIGMVLVVSAAQAEPVIQQLQAEGESVYRMGEVVSRDTEAVIYG